MGNFQWSFFGKYHFASVAILAEEVEEFQRWILSQAYCTWRDWSVFSTLGMCKLEGNPNWNKPTIWIYMGVSKNRGGLPLKWMGCKGTPYFLIDVFFWYPYIWNNFKNIMIVLCISSCIHAFFYILLTSSSNMISPLVPKVADEDLLESANKRLEELQDEILASFDVNQVGTRWWCNHMLFFFFRDLGVPKYCILFKSTLNPENAGFILNSKWFHLIVWKTLQLDCRFRNEIKLWIICWLPLMSIVGQVFIRQNMEW